MTLFPSSYDPPLPPMHIPPLTPRTAPGTCWSELVVAEMEKEFGPITPHPDPEKARLLAESSQRQKLRTSREWTEQ